MSERRTVAVYLTFELGEDEDSEADGIEAADALVSDLLDEGIPQDALNEAAQDRGLDIRVVDVASLTVEVLSESMEHHPV